jgi:hypothetical protein
VAPRAEFTLHLAPLLPPTVKSERLDGALQQVLVVDLFEPPQREAYRAPVMELTANGLKQRDIAWELALPKRRCSAPLPFTAGKRRWRSSTRISEWSLRRKMKIAFAGTGTGIRGFASNRCRVAPKRHRRFKTLRVG